MPPLYVHTQGAHLCYRGRRLVVEKDDQEIAAVPAVHVDPVLIFGNVTITTPALSFLLDQGICTVFLTVDGRYKGRLEGPTGGHGPLRLLQYRRVSDAAWALETAREIVAAKLHNMRTLLRRYARRIGGPTAPSGEPSPETGPDGPSPQTPMSHSPVGMPPHPTSAGADAVAPVGAGHPEASSPERTTPGTAPAVGDDRSAALTAAADELTALIGRLSRCRTILSLSGVEGRGTAVYFSVFRPLIDRPGWRFEKRVRRPPGDPVNVLLSLGYTVLAHNAESAVRTVGLDPYLGFLHQVEYNRPSLALDLMEPFRPIVGDSVVLRVINNAILRPEHFVADPEGPYPVRLLDEGRSLFIRELEARLNLELTHPTTGERMNYRRALEVEARQLAHALLGGEPFRPFQVR